VLVAAGPVYVFLTAFFGTLADDHRAAMNARLGVIVLAWRIRRALGPSAAAMPTFAAWRDRYGRPKYPVPRSGRQGTSRTNPLAIGALVSGIGQFGFPPACVATIILGHMARRQIRQTGDRGSRIATAGLILGYFLVALVVLGLLLRLVPGPPQSRQR
jgi:hypothetical protein